ncbi:MAG: hypothetical protein ACLVKO_06030 [Dysgonomonas sp.]
MRWLTKNSRKKISDIAEKTDMPIDLSPEYLELDFPPADNNTTIVF